MGTKMLSKIQLGREASGGATDPPTTIWRGLGFINDEAEVVFPEENVGLLVPTDRTYIPWKQARLEFAETEATFEQLIHILEAGLKSIGTGVADGAGTGKIYNYPFPITSPVAVSDTDGIKTYRIEGGDNVDAEEMEYSFVEEFTLSGAAKEAWKVSAKWIGRQVTTDTFTTALSIPTVEECLFPKTKLYIDTSSDSFGTTQKTNTLIEAKLLVKTGWVPVPVGDGNTYFAFAKNVGPEITLDIVFEHDATAIAEKTLWRAQTTRNVSLICQGTALTTPGTAYTYKTLQIDVAGKWSKFEPLDERDGNTVISATLKGAYNVTNAKIGQIIVVNQLTSVP